MSLINQINEIDINTCSPLKKQIFFSLYNLEHRDFFQSISDRHVFTVPLIMSAKIFNNSELADKFIKDNNLKGFRVCRITPQYSFE